MKTKMNIQKVLLSVGLLFPLWTANAQLTIPGANGSDNPFNPTGSNYVVNLANAAPGVWTDNPSTPGNGVYDAAKWAVVFKYPSVNIPAGTTVTFINHPSRAPVVWLVSGDVTINGVLSLNGQGQTTSNVDLPEPGPGGFRGGAHGQANLAVGPGFGPGGFSANNDGYYKGSYGNAQILPLIGGSGGSGWSSGWNGSGGGGAILIAASGKILIGGYVSANASRNNGAYYQGSGGAIRLLAGQILGAGRVEANSEGAGVGRIRLEANFVSQALSLNPITIGVPPTTINIWPPPSAPTVKVVSVAGMTAPADPRAVMANNGDDLTLTNTGPTAILLETTSFATNGTVNVSIKPRNGNQGVYQARFLSGTANLATWQLLTNVPLGHFVIQARAVTP